MATRSHSFYSSHLVGAAAIFLLAAIHAPLTVAQRQPPPWLLCGPADSGNYTENSTYQANINRLSATLPKNASSSPVLYAADSVGSVPDRLRPRPPPRRRLRLRLRELRRHRLPRRAGGVPAVQGRHDLLRPLQAPLLQPQLLPRGRLLHQHLRSPGASCRDEHAGGGVRRSSRPACQRHRPLCGGGLVEEIRHRRARPREERHQDLRAVAVHAGQDAGDYRYEVYPFFSGRPLLQLPTFLATEQAPAPSAPPEARRRGKPRNRTGTVLEIIMPITGALVAITIICCYWRRRMKAVPPSDPTSSDDIESIDMLLIDLSTIRLATENFAESKILGRGGFGMVYKGVLPDGQEIAVKRLSQSSRQGIGELKSELVLVAKLHHRNLVRLIGVCLQENEKILVYEYMPNTSLDTILFDSEGNKVLDWGKRFKIINGIARGLQYLHEDSRLKIVHRDLKASNILLDLDYDPKISDFGLAKIFGEDKSRYVTLRIAGTYGYMAPEYAMRGQYSIKSDVFSFGVLVLEIVTGRRNSGSCNTKKVVDLLSHVLEHWTRGNVIELIDPSLSDNPPVEQLMKCIHIGLLCLQRKPAARPVMSSVNIMLSSGTVHLPSVSRSDFFIQDVSASDSTDGYSASQPAA
ncbi:hypothetical protein ACP70R_034676 [Stipagrostis hirtigluma subsp. patula]